MQSRFVLVGEISDVGAPGRVATAVRVEDGVIKDIGGQDVVDSAHQDDVVVVDLGDRYISPGFVDAHAHLEVGVRAQTQLLDCRVPVVRSITDLLDHLASHRGQARAGWLVGQGNLFYDQKLSDGRLPTRQELDSVSSGLAVAIRAGGHTTVLNTRALESFDFASFERGEGMMGGAIVERDDTGAPSGMLAELDAAIPFPTSAEGEFDDSVIEGTRSLFTRYGVTTVGDISETLAGLRAIQSTAEARALPVRVVTHLWAPGTLTFDQALRWGEHLPAPAASDRFDIRGIKVFADGGFSSRNAAVRTPFLQMDPSDPNACGRISIDSNRLEDYIARAGDSDLQLVVHANGERTQDAVCAAVLAASTASMLPVRLEHAGNLVTTTETYDRWHEAGVVPVSQAVFLYNFGDFFVPLLGEAAGNGRFPFRTMREQGFGPVASSDLHLGSEPEQTNPLFSMWCAVERITFLGQNAVPGESLDIRDALEMHTLAGAKALGRDKWIGSIEVGKFADFAVLACNPERAPSLRTLQVDLVLLEGEVVHHAVGMDEAVARLRP